MGRVIRTGIARHEGAEGRNRVAMLRAVVRELPPSAAEDDALFDQIAEAPIVLIGEASHGTHEFYQERADITRRLILERGFSAVAIEGDWPDTYRVNRFVRGADDDG